MISFEIGIRLCLNINSLDDIRFSSKWSRYNWKWTLAGEYGCLSLVYIANDNGLMISCEIGQRLCLNISSHNDIRFISKWSRYNLKWTLAKEYGLYSLVNIANDNGLMISCEIGQRLCLNINNHNDIRFISKWSRYNLKWTLAGDYGWLSLVYIANDYGLMTSCEIGQRLCLNINNHNDIRFISKWSRYNLKWTLAGKYGRLSLFYIAND
jgi:hypothetical protein